MGVASFREDIYQRFLDSTDGFPELRLFTGPPLEVCPFCSSGFVERVQLLQHLSAIHHGERPFLMVFGREPDEQVHFGEKIDPNEVSLQNCTSAKVRINGGQNIHTTPAKVGPLLAHEADALVELELENKFAKKAEPVRQRYHITIRVPPKKTLDNVDLAFLEHTCDVFPQVSGVSPQLEFKIHNFLRAGVRHSGSHGVDFLGEGRGDLLHVHFGVFVSIFVCEFPKNPNRFDSGPSARLCQPDELLTLVGIVACPLTRRLTRNSCHFSSDFLAEFISTEIYIISCEKKSSNF